jgi:hypothetical protein
VSCCCLPGRQTGSLCVAVVADRVHTALPQQLLGCCCHPDAVNESQSSMTGPSQLQGWQVGAYCECMHAAHALPCRPAACAPRSARCPLLLLYPPQAPEACMLRSCGIRRAARGRRRTASLGCPLGFHPPSCTPKPAAGALRSARCPPLLLSHPRHQGHRCWAAAASNVLCAAAVTLLPRAKQSLPHPRA